MPPAPRRPMPARGSSTRAAAGIAVEAAAGSTAPIRAAGAEASAASAGSRMRSRAATCSWTRRGSAAGGIGPASPPAEPGLPFAAAGSRKGPSPREGWLRSSSSGVVMPPTRGSRTLSTESCIHQMKPPVPSVVSGEELSLLFSWHSSAA